MREVRRAVATQPQMRRALNALRLANVAAASGNGREQFFGLAQRAMSIPHSSELHSLERVHQIAREISPQIAWKRTDLLKN
jgi:hypothetical protein